MTRSACVDQIAATILAARFDHPTRVGIDGVDGVGKTTLADDLAGRLGRTGRQLIRTSVDGFHNPREFRYRRGERSPEGYFLDTFDYVALRSELLDPLGPAGSRSFRRAVFDYRNNQPVDAEAETAENDAILLFDGVFLQRPELQDIWDIRIWVEAPFGVTVSRAVKRDVGDSERTEATRAKYEQRYVPGQLMYLEQCRPKEAADIIVNNEDLENPQIQFRERV